LNPEAPAADEHHRWMQRTLADPARTLLIIEQQGTSVGMVRLDRVTNCQFPRRYDISIAVDAAFNGHGIASAALGLVRRFKPAAILAADIVASNTASKELFLRAGFTRTRADHYESLPS
jgi:RimJ/RimL family protein N-acetyltransferase